jgi:asparagine synthase (glutamine-hydrolysing)
VDEWKLPESEGLQTTVDSLDGDWRNYQRLPTFPGEPNHWQEVERALLSPLSVEKPQAAVARLESRRYLGSQLLRDLDVMSMAHGLEVRVPLLDRS